METKDLVNLNREQLTDYLTKVYNYQSALADYQSQQSEAKADHDFEAGEVAEEIIKNHRLAQKDARIKASRSIIAESKDELDERKELFFHFDRWYRYILVLAVIGVLLCWLFIGKIGGYIGEGVLIVAVVWGIVKLGKDYRKNKRRMETLKKKIKVEKSKLADYHAELKKQVVQDIEAGTYDHSTEIDNLVNTDDANREELAETKENLAKLKVADVLPAELDDMNFVLHALDQLRSGTANTWTEVTANYHEH